MNKLRSITVPLPERCGTFFCFFRSRQNYKKHFSVLLGLVFIFIAGCSTGRVLLTGSLPAEREVITDYPEGCSKYDWIHSVPESTDDYHYFVGVSNKHAAETNARDQALMHCIKQFAEYCEVDIKIFHQYLAEYSGESSSVIDPDLTMRDSVQHIAKAFVSRVKSKEFCRQQITEPSGTSGFETFWKVYALATVPVDEVEIVKNYRPPPPLSLHVIKMENNKCCIEVRSHLGMPVTNFQIRENGRRIFPNKLCVTDNEGYRITGSTAKLDFSNRRSILLGGNDSTFNFQLIGAGKITADYSINNRPDTLSLQY